MDLTTMEEDDFTDSDEEEEEEEEEESNGNEEEEEKGPEEPVAGMPRRRRKNKIVISLYIHSVPYKFGLMCQFCEKEKAILHCPLCEDFLCFGCDFEIHRHEKRKEHHRDKLSKYSIKTGSTCIQHFFRFVMARKKLRALCRFWVERKFDKHTLCWYYVNKKEKTSSWTRPRVMGTELLTPFPTPDACQYRIAGLYWMWRSREEARWLIRFYFEKIYDIVSRRFYYFYKGPSPLQPPSIWRKPYLLHPFDLEAVFTEDVAALFIQKAWRRFASWKFLKQLLRRVYRREWDPIEGRYFYKHNFNRKKTIHGHPCLLKGELWDPREYWLWDSKQVILFLRRLGLKKYVHEFQLFNVNGAMLSIFEDIDFFNLGIDSSVDKLKIRVGLESLWAKDQLPKVHPRTIFQVNKIRLHRKYEEASLVVQCWWRQFLAREVLKKLVDDKRIKEYEDEIKEEVERSAVWWHLREGALDVPQNTIEKKVSTLSYRKTWGKRPLYLSARGWGHWEGSEWIPQERPETIEEEKDFRERKQRSKHRPARTVDVLPSIQSNPRSYQQFTEEWGDIHASYHWTKKLEQNSTFKLPSISKNKYN